MTPDKNQTRIQATIHVHPGEQSAVVFDTHASVFLGGVNGAHIFGSIESVETVLQEAMDALDVARDEAEETS